MTERNPRMNRKSATKDFLNKIEETNQSELGTDTNGNSIADYVTRALRDVAKRIGLKLPEVE